MNIIKHQNGNQLVIALEGRLDTMTAPQLEQELTDSLKDVTDLTLDFSGLEYISSAGLRVVFLANKRMAGAGKMRIVHVNEIIQEGFEVTGFSTGLTIEA